MRFFRPLSGMGQMNFPVEPMAQVRAAGAARVGRGHLAGDHGAEGVAHEGRALEAQLLQQLLVTEDQVPEAVQVIDVVGRAGARSGMLGGMNGEMLSERVEERIPVEAPGAVEEDEVGTGALGEDAHEDATLPDGEQARLRAVEAAHRAVTAGSERARSFSGHQWLTQPSSSQKPRRDGSTSREKRSMFCRVSSWGMEPICRSTIRLPTRRPLTTSSSRRWRTVAGLPAMT